MNRQDQYKRKFEFILDKIMNLPKNPDKNEFYIDALFYRLQISIDATMDIVAMLCKDLGISVKDDYNNMDELEKFKLFEMKTLEDLRRWNGLRNVLVHKYNEIENEIIFKNKAQVIKTLKDFVKKAEEIIDERIFKSNIIKNDLSFVKEYWAIMYGSYVDENYISGRSDIDVAIISQSKVREKNKELFDSLLPNIIPPYDIKVFELLPLYLQMEIINNYEVLFGDPLEISEYLYQFRKIWKDMKNRIENNRFNTIKEKIELIERRKEILEKI